MFSDPGFRLALLLSALVLLGYIAGRLHAWVGYRVGHRAGWYDAQDFRLRMMREGTPEPATTTQMPDEEHRRHRNSAHTRVMPTYRPGTAAVDEKGTR